MSAPQVVQDDNGVAQAKALAGWENSRSLHYAALRSG